MRTAIRWAARLYPTRWRGRYGAEIDSLLGDISPCLGDLCDVLGHALGMRAAHVVDASRMWGAVSSMPSRLPVLLSIAVHSLIFGVLCFASWAYMTPMPLLIASAPLPPPPPDPPPQVTDPRVFPSSAMLYSSLPIQVPAQGGSLFTSVVLGVGLRFPALPDVGVTYWHGKPARRVWSGSTLEESILRRVLPDYPRPSSLGGAVSIFIEYLIALDGSVTVLRTSGPSPYSDVAKRAVEHWAYRPIRYDNVSCEAVTRVEIRFDGFLLGSFPY